MTWLLDTLVWTGALIAVVLLVRRPVARHFGAGIAYALWLLPMLRLALPPLVLPAPAERVQPAPAMEPEITAVVELTQTAALAQAPEPSAPFLMADLAPALIALWLAGAVVYVALRLGAYRRLRRDLLAGARTVGLAGKVRLLETAGTRSPLAFGVLDKVVALPVGFMAQTDRAARDLALEHELAHHRAHDLAANFAALPLFAIHWFNPLSWLGWTAMRRDQEAACDARVVEGRGRDERARYAALIAGAAASPRTALAAPMACPVLGDKSIVQRLRNLTMTDHTRRRRRTGGLLVGVGALLLPLTASITYAQIAEPEEDTAPPAPPLAPEAPLPPEAPAAPDSPDAPEPPSAPDAPGMHVEIVDREPGQDQRERVVVVREHEAGHAPGERVIHMRKDGKVLPPDSPEFQAQMKMLEEKLGKLDKEFADRVVIDSKRFKMLSEDAARAGARMALMAPRVEMNCDGPDGMSEARGEDGQRVFRFCRSRIMETATMGLRSARASIAANRDMDASTRKEVLESLDREIARLEAKN